jgi:hypothetical protein
MGKKHIMPVLFQNSSEREALCLRQGRVGGDRLRKCVDRIVEQDGVAIVSLSRKGDR